VSIPEELFIHFGTLLVGGLGIAVALHNQTRQLKAQTYIEYSRRFEELLRLFPAEAWLANRNPSRPLPPPDREITACTLHCIQFVADVYYMHESGYISRRLWKLCEREMGRTLKGPLFRREWSVIADDFAHDPELFAYLSTLIGADSPITQ
jgi:hypothetical protein